ncbi:MAG: peptidoglycan-binding protein [Chthoniobacter sp.]|uniref:peptidoglycan-binding protein n=1 Tax=Chthoniobacter sp. TaxID=2510640 RepID=UPI0032AE4E30
MKTKLFCALATLVITSAAFADDQVRNVQTELKSQGFYYGDVDGQNGAEMTSALRRYQIRNGLEVTGTLSQETLASLGMVAASKPKAQVPALVAQVPPRQPAQAKASPPVNIRRDESVEESDRAFLQREESKNRNRAANVDEPASAPTPAYRDPSIASHRDAGTSGGYRDPANSGGYRDPANSGGYHDPGTPSYRDRDPSVIPPPAPLDAPSADFPVLFAGTPYANAPVTVQQDTLRRVQSKLADRGYYRDIVDGLPGPATEEALLSYQRSARLTLTGRLDLETLSELRLLPRDNSGAGGAAQFGFEFRTSHHVFRGVWVDRR